MQLELRVDSNGDTMLDVDERYRLPDSPDLFAAMPYTSSSSSSNANLSTHQFPLAAMGSSLALVGALVTIIFYRHITKQGPTSIRDDPRWRCTQIQPAA